MDDEGSDDSRTLRRIAEALGVTAEQLFLHGQLGCAPASQRAELRALVQAFSKISDPETRDPLLWMVEDAARIERSAGDPG